MIDEDLDDGFPAGRPHYAERPGGFERADRRSAFGIPRKVQAMDGRWLALDGRMQYRVTVAAANTEPSTTHALRGKQERS